MQAEAIVIGCGPLGSATARHLAEAGVDVVLVGPDVEGSSGPNAPVYASHHDVSRVVRPSGHDALWTRVNVLSIAGLRGLGPAVFQEVGAATGVVDTGPDRVTGPTLGHPLEVRDGHPMPWRYDGEVLWEPTGGTLNPLALVRAQVERFEAAGGRRVLGVVRADGDGFFVGDERLEADNVVVAAGAYSAGLLGLPDRARPKAEATVLVEVPEAWLEAYGHLPGWIDDAQGDGWSDRYAIGPRRYGDGKVYVKLGANLDSDVYPTDAEGIRRWFDDGVSADQLSVLLDALVDLWPALEGRPAHVKRCVVTYTDTGRPYIHEVRDGVWWVGPGIGYSAMASDGIGQLAARALRGEAWPAGLGREAFAFGDVPR